MSRPNLVLIHTHDTGRHLGCYGADAATPNLNRLASQGVLFRRAFCASPSCSASRASLLTGLYPHNNGMIGLCHRGFRLNDPRQHLSNLLRDAGYATQLIGVQHEVMPADLGGLGYDNVIENSKLELHSAERGKLAANWLRSVPKRPFFLNVGFYETHRKFLPAESPDDPRFIAPLPWLPDDPKIRGDVAELNTAVRHVDQAVGSILHALDETKLAGNTLVIFTTDHGIPFPRAKGTLYDAGIGVSLILRGLEVFSGGKTIDSQVSQVDVLPTILPMLDVSVPAHAQGTSFLPVVQGRASSTRDDLFAEMTFHAAYDPMRCIRTERYKYIRYFEERPRVVLPNIDDSPTKDRLVELGYCDGESPKELLFDLVSDPQECANLTDKPSMAGVRDDLRQRLRRWMESTNDPLLKGRVPLPPGGVLTPITARSPTDRRQSMATFKGRAVSGKPSESCRQRS
jgi:arylsulfatase A-like enzyme